MHKRYVFLVLLTMLPLLVFAGAEQKKDAWEPLRFLVGTWEGGQPGVSKVTQVYSFVLKGTFMKMKTNSVFEPTDKNPSGEVHEDFGIFSFDSGKKTFVLRGFYVEGFVNHYLLDSTSPDGKTLTFITDHVENAPPGTKAKLVFKKTGEGEMEQSFFVAWPNKDYNCFFAHKLKKQKK